VIKTAMRQGQDVVERLVGLFRGPSNTAASGAAW